MTAKFSLQGDFVARAEGMPDVPRVEVPHPVAGIGPAAMAALGRNVSAQVIARLRGE